MVVYTCILNNKDRLINVQREEGVRFVCFTDMKIGHPVWEIIPADVKGMSDPRRVARRYKILSHLYFPGETTIWVDGRVRLLNTAKYYADKYKGLVCARPHHDRNCLYQEANQVVKINYDTPEQVNPHIERVRATGYPPHNGLHETGMLLRRPGCEAFNEKWWAWLSAGSKRDQLSFDLVAWLMDIEITDINREEVQVVKHRIATNFYQ